MLRTVTVLYCPLATQCPAPPNFTRPNAIQRIKGVLEHNAFIRFQSNRLVGFTGVAGRLFSFVMLQEGVASMVLRYQVILLVACDFFVLLLGLWPRTKAEDDLDIRDRSGLVPSSPFHINGIPYAIDW